jgi:septal ring factor EnvC (AmiA/AmiB activator)
MKKLWFLVIAIPLIMASCNTHEKELKQMAVKTDSLQKQISVRDQSVSAFMSDFNEIEKNLSTIKEKEHLLSSMSNEKSGETNVSAKERITSDINDIYNLLAKNKSIIASLNRKIKNSNGKLDEFQKIVDNLNTQLADKDREIEAMKGQLANLNTKVSDLSTNVASLESTTKEQQQVIEEKTTALNTAYYVVGTKQDLEKNKLIAKEGGLLGIGKTYEMGTKVDKSKFTKVDITQFATLPIDKKKLKLITTHPVGSYKIVSTKDKVSDIVITDPEEFWSISKYLIAEVK